MARTATTEQVAAALHVKPATVRKYARGHRLPFDTTPGGHRRFDVEEAVRAMAGTAVTSRSDTDDWDGGEAVPFARVAPTRSFAASTAVANVTPRTVRVRDSAADVEDWAAETSVV